MNGNDGLGKSGQSRQSPSAARGGYATAAPSAYPLRPAESLARGVLRRGQNAVTGPSLAFWVLIKCICNLDLKSV